MWLLLLAVPVSSLSSSAPLSIAASTERDEPLKVLVSVKPLALIAQELVGEHANVETLVGAGRSPHHYSLTVTDRQEIDEADLVVWVGPELERFLEKPLRSARNSLALFDAPVEEDDHSNEHRHGDETHPWLAPDQAAAIARTITAELIKQDVSGEALYQSRLESFLVTLGELDAYIAGRLQEATGGYAVAHDAFRGLTEHYHLPEPFVLSVNPELAPSARKLWQLQQALPPGSCLLVEAEHRRRWVDSITESQNLKLKLVDTLASDAEVSAYNQYILGVAGIFEECLEFGDKEEKDPAQVN